MEVHITEVRMEYRNCNFVLFQDLKVLRQQDREHHRRRRRCECVSSDIINWRISARVSRASRTSHRKKRPAEIVCENEQKAKRRGKKLHTHITLQNMN